ncbi:MAG: calcium/sodium antiporter [Bacteroidota bacterium]|nr:calcium/sodium antiporter [Bacteroidota bacterium]
MMTIFILFLGFILLFFGGELLVRASVSLATKMNVSTLVIGMTIVSFATSAPELFVSLKAVFSNSGDISLGNSIGSNIANIAFVLAITAIFFKVKIAKKVLSLNYPLLLISSLLLAFILYYFKGVSSFIGYLFVIILITYVLILINDARDNQLNAKSEERVVTSSKNTITYFKSISMLLLGVLLLKYGADFLVNSAMNIADYFEVPERVIAVTIVAIGTSIPELAASIIAAYRNEDSLAIGNLIGSNVFNIFAVLGLTAIIKPINMIEKALLSFDTMWMLAITIVFGASLYLNKKRYLYRKEGLFLFIMYLLYIYLALN